jgi:hypothetical protein
MARHIALADLSDIHRRDILRMVRIARLGFGKPEPRQSAEKPDDGPMQQLPAEFDIHPTQLDADASKGRASPAGHHGDGENLLLAVAATALLVDHLPVGREGAGHARHDQRYPHRDALPRRGVGQPDR